MDKRLEAQKNGQVTYDSGKPCRRGHNALRYSSTGACIECLKVRNEAAQNLSKANKAKMNLARAQGLTSCAFMVAENHRQIVQKLCDLLQYGDLNTITNINDTINAWFDTTPTPRALFRDKLQELVPDMGAPAIMAMFKSGTLQNDAKYGVTFFVHNGMKYLWADVERVLSGQKQSVSPAPLVNDSTPAIPEPTQAPRLNYAEIAQIGTHEPLSGHDDLYGPFVTRGGHLFRHADILARQRAGFGSVDAHTAPPTPRPAVQAPPAPAAPPQYVPPPPVTAQPGEKWVTLGELGYIQWDGEEITNFVSLPIYQCDGGDYVLNHCGAEFPIAQVEELLAGRLDRVYSI